MSTLISITRVSRRGIIEKDFAFESCKKIFLVFSIVTPPLAPPLPLPGRPPRAPIQDV